MLGVEWQKVNPCSLRKQYSVGCSELTSHCVKANSSDLNKSTEDNNEEGWGFVDEKEVQRGQSGRIEKVAQKS